MVRPECYQCAKCGKPWREFYPRLACGCGCDVLKLTRPAPVAEPEPEPEPDAAGADVGAGVLGPLLAAVGAALVERLFARRERIARVELDLDDLDDWYAPVDGAGWSPYPLGNGTDGVIHA